MQVTAIKVQQGRSDRYSVFIDGAYAVSVSATAILDLKILPGQELTRDAHARLQDRAEFDQLYDQALGYVTRRTRSRHELATFLQKKHCPAPLTEQITNRLLQAGLVNDRAYAQAYVHDRRALRPTSRRKIIGELRQKKISQEVITTIVGTDEVDERTALAKLIQSKRRQSRYQDDTKLLAYLSRQGFSYHDIKEALSREITDFSDFDNQPMQ